MNAASTSGRCTPSACRVPGRSGWSRTRCRPGLVRGSGNGCTQANVISVFELQDVPTHLQISQLLTHVFFDDPEQNTPVRRTGPLDRLSHRVSNLLWSLTLHAARPFNHYTLYLTDQPPADQPPATQGGQAQVVASVVLSFERLQGQALQALGARAPLPVGWVSSLAVHPQHRGRGLATNLMQACEQLAMGALPGGGCLCLHVYRDNPRAQRLYQRLGYHEARWLDPRWLESAERGQMGPPQRLLMYKPFGALPMPEHPPADTLAATAAGSHLEACQQ